MIEIKIDKIIKTKRKSIALIIDDKARLIIRAPVNTPAKYIEKIVAEKEKWIKTKQEMIKSRNKSYAPKKYISGENFLVLGENFKMKIVSDEIKNICAYGRELLFPGKYLDYAEKHMLSWYKKKAKELINERVKFFSTLLDIDYNSVKITDAKKRWGSCSAKGNLNFSWRLFMAPPKVIDYVVVHELMHIKVLNHSKEFWDRVKTVMPDYKNHKQWLNGNQNRMRIR